MAATTAFTSVSARRGFERPDSKGSFPPAFSAPGPRVSQEAPPTRKVEWSKPVREYVQRAFQPANAIAGIEKQAVELKLKQTLSSAAESGRLENIEWDTLPLPQQLIQQERAMAAWSAPSATDNAWIPIESPESASKKRKIGLEPSTPSENRRPTPPWEKDNNSSAFGERVTYSSKKQQSKMEKRLRKEQEALGQGSSKFEFQAEKRKQRFGAQLEDSPPWGNYRESTPPIDLHSGPVVGICQVLEKRYFRLNGAPKPEEVRPLAVLKKTFEHIKQKWHVDGNYTYTCDQFKSMRQDLTVQHIKNEFTVQVYELHARIALEMRDLGEYNQCQTQLRALYALKLAGSPAEFLAYRILYFVHTCNRTGLNDILSEITPELKQDPAVKHALAVRSAQASGNYHKLLAKLYQEVPNMGAYLMDMFVGRERLAAMAIICKSYKPNVSIEFLAEELGFDSYELALEFLEKQGVEKAGLLIQPADAAEVKNLAAWKIDAAKAAPLFQAARSTAFHTVDIKGQI